MGDKPIDYADRIRRISKRMKEEGIPNDSMTVKQHKRFIEILKEEIDKELESE